MGPHGGSGGTAEVAVEAGDLHPLSQVLRFYVILHVGLVPRLELTLGTTEAAVEPHTFELHNSV